MAKSKTFIFDLVYFSVIIPFLVFLVLLFFNAFDALVRGPSLPHPLPQRILSLPASELIGDFTGGERVIYAKEPLFLEGTSVIYTVCGYLKASWPLDSAIGIYVRAKDPVSDPTCKLLTVPLQTQSEVQSSSVYVCERGQSDAKAKVAEFTNVSFTSFCFSNREASRVVSQGEFWIGLEWDPFLPPSLTWLFDHLTAITYPCPSESR